ASGLIKAPEGIDPFYPDRIAVITLTISGESLSDSVEFTGRPSQHGNVWQFQGVGNGNLDGIGLNIEKVSLWWAPDMGNWTGWAGFHIFGEFIMPEGVNGGTQPPQVTLTLEVTTAADSAMTGEATVLCDVSGNGTVWQYNIHTGWPNLPFTLPEDD
ncbi:MAG: hypothetical protein JW856_02525, partial [Dehalococcoidales bacterium]|nr:hypothetical protein [Dehalococcoidales bacterium]